METDAHDHEQEGSYPHHMLGAHGSLQYHGTCGVDEEHLHHDWRVLEEFDVDAGDGTQRPRARGREDAQQRPHHEREDKPQKRDPHRKEEPLPQEVRVGERRSPPVSVGKFHAVSPFLKQAVTLGERIDAAV